MDLKSTQSLSGQVQKASPPEEKGYSDGTSVYLFLDEEEVVSVQKGMEACVLEESGRVEAVSDIPVSYQEAAEFLGGEGMAHALLMTEGDWKYKVELSGIHVKKGPGRKSF